MITTETIPDLESLVLETLQLAEQINSIVEAFIAVEERYNLTAQEGKQLVKRCLAELKKKPIRPKAVLAVCT